MLSHVYLSLFMCTFCSIGCYGNNYFLKYFLFLKFIFDLNILKNRKYFCREKQTHSLSLRFGSLFLTLVKDLFGA